MAVFPNPLSNDGVDKLNHKWMVMLLVVLSLVAFIVPLHPSFQDKSEISSSRVSRQVDSGNEDYPEVQVQCWSPSEFTSAMTRYVNSFCGNVYNSLNRGSEDYIGHIYLISDREIPVNDNHLKNEFQKIFEEIQVKRKESERQKSEMHKLKVSVQNVVTYQIPIVLFVLAICLGIPQLIWTLLSDWFSPLSVGKTLETANQISRADASSRQQMYEELAVCIARCASTKITGVLYLFRKTLSVVAAIVLLLVITKYSLPEVEGLNKDCKNTKSIPAIPVIPYDNFFCDVRIRKLQAMQHWTMQCNVASHHASNGLTMTQTETNATDANAETNSSPLENEINLLQFETTLLKIVMSVLVILLVSNVVSLTSWVAKLLCQSSSLKSSLGLSSNSAMDIVFLVHMARINASVDVTQMLARSSSSDLDNQMGLSGIKNSH